MITLTRVDLAVLRAIWRDAHVRGRITDEDFAQAIAAFDAAEHRLDDPWADLRSVSA